MISGDMGLIGIAASSGICGGTGTGGGYHCGGVGARGGWYTVAGRLSRSGSFRLFLMKTFFVSGFFDLNEVPMKALTILENNPLGLFLSRRRDWGLSDLAGVTS